MTMVLMPPPELDLRVFGWGRELAQHRQIARQIARPILPLGSFARRLLAKPKQAACALAVVLGCHYLTPDQIQERAAAIRQETKKPFGLNFLTLPEPFAAS